MRLPNPLAAYWRFEQVLVRTLHEAETDLLMIEVQMWRHRGALWAMATTVAILWIVVLVIFLLTT